jgi:hypothetical protein
VDTGFWIDMAINFVSLQRIVVTASVLIVLYAFQESLLHGSRNELPCWQAPFNRCLLS